MSELGEKKAEKALLKAKKLLESVGELKNEN